ncbi:hypothetical protein QJS04_geneDACA001482 [Acorus gramineus]|uniref:MICOS complex subunit MIC10 n=1 Tax=Acorus gramineus TaxID=55184 RepID=A0AAV8ZWC5_ACOGR|nr:hypothetical protein QJS04_geneDACA001482 [Acorus gramineus]
MVSEYGQILMVCIRIRKYVLDSWGVCLGFMVGIIGGLCLPFKREYDLGFMV